MGMPMHAPSLAETTAFVAVVELKSFTKAAKQLALSPPRVSEMVRNLEERLGVRLVERTTRSVAPTAAGERLLERLRPVLDEYQSALESANEFRGRPAGLLRLTAPPPAADFFLASAIPRFLAQYPEISLDLSFNDALTDIVAERFDAGIRIGERIERDMIAVRVTDELPLVVVGSPAYFAQRGKPISPKDLVAHDCIRTRFASGAYLPWRFRVKRRDLEVHVEGPLVVNSASLARRVAVEGLALIQTPLLFIASDLSEGKLTTVLDQWAPTPVTGFFLYYASRRQMRPALKALVDFLRDEHHGASKRLGLSPVLVTEIFRCPMSALGQSLHGRPSGKSGHVGYAAESGSKFRAADTTLIEEAMNSLWIKVSQLGQERSFIAVLNRHKSRHANLLALFRINQARCQGAPIRLQSRQR